MPEASKLSIPKIPKMQARLASGNSEGNITIFATSKIKSQKVYTVSINMQ